MSYDSLKIVAGWTVVVEDEKTMRWLAVLEPDQRREGAEASAFEQQQRSAVQCNAHTVQSNNTAVFSDN